MVSVIKSDPELRKLGFLEESARFAEKCYDRFGRWRLGLHSPETRERYWICFALYECGNAPLADAVVIAGEDRRTHLGGANAASFDIFHSNIACLLLLRHREKMSQAAVFKLETLVRESFGFQPGNRRPDYQFHGYNDNMPAKATMGLILGGEMLDCDSAVNHGLWNLRQLRKLLRRRGTVSEWNSPTYTPATLHAIAEIAAEAKNLEARLLAKSIEERLWIDLAARFHPGMGAVAGPYSRAYTVDTAAHLTCVSSLLWFVLGDIVNPSPMLLFHRVEKMILHHMGDVPFNVAQMCWFAAGKYSIPEIAARMFAKKNFPFHAVATAETGNFGKDTPAHPVRIETYLEKNYAVGTSSAAFLAGEQSTPYFVIYKRKEPVRSFADVGTIFYKFVINDEAPGAIHDFSAANGNEYVLAEQDNLSSHSNYTTVQSGCSALIVTSPHNELAASKMHPENNFTRLSEMIIFDSHFGNFDEIRIGSREQHTWSGEVPCGEWIGCRRGHLLIGLRPLAFQPDPSITKITLEKLDGYDVLRSTFYEGPARSFSKDDLHLMFGGFVTEHADVGEYSSLAEFMEVLSRSKLTDYNWTTRVVRYTRDSTKSSPPLELAVSWSPGAVVPRYATVNDKTVAWDNPVNIDGLTSAKIPFLGDLWEPDRDSFPWTKLEAVWEGKTETGHVGARSDFLNQIPDHLSQNKNRTHLPQSSLPTL